MKASVSDPVIVRDFMALAPRIRFFFTERGYVEARKLGHCGFLISLASVNPAQAKAFVAGDDAFRQQAFEGVQAMGKKLLPATGTSDFQP